MTEQQTIGFIGAGNMATSLIGGLKDKFDEIWVSDLSGEALSRFDVEPSIHTTKDNKVVIEHADVLVLATKPQVFASVLPEISSQVMQKCPLVISIAAGVSLQSMRDELSHDVPIIRCMPNTPALIGLGMTVLCANDKVTSEQTVIATEVLASVGETAWVNDEALLDPVTAVSGSGPAYFFLLMESLVSAAKAQGIEEGLAKQLVLQTALGSVQLASQSDDELATLRQKVTSPGGTTEAALQSLASANFAKVIEEAVDSATNRSKML